MESLLGLEDRGGVVEWKTQGRQKMLKRLKVALPMSQRSLTPVEPGGHCCGRRGPRTSWKILQWETAWCWSLMAPTWSMISLLSGVEPRSWLVSLSQSTSQLEPASPQVRCCLPRSSAALPGPGRFHRDSFFSFSLSVLSSLNSL